jgi:hypothetical protein
LAAPNLTEGLRFQTGAARYVSSVGAEPTVFRRGFHEIVQLLEEQTFNLSGDDLKALESMLPQDPALSDLELSNPVQAMTVVIFTRLLFEFERLGQRQWRAGRSAVLSYIQNPRTGKGKRRSLGELTAKLGENNVANPSASEIFSRADRLQAIYPTLKTAA